MFFKTLEGAKNDFKLSIRKKHSFELSLKASWQMRSPGYGGAVGRARDRGFKSSHKAILFTI